jgi:hypothetical protein
MGLFGLKLHPEALERFENRLDELERQVKLLTIEWQETLDMMKRRMFRTIKERERIEHAQPDVVEGQEQPATATSLDPISERIISRRNRMMRREQ